MSTDKFDFHWWSTQLVTALLALLVPLSLFAAFLALSPLPQLSDGTDPKILGTYGWITIPVLFYLASLWGFIWNQWRARYLQYRRQKHDIIADADPSTAPPERPRWRLVDWACWFVPTPVVAILFSQGEFFWFPMAAFWLLLCLVGAYVSRYGLVGYLLTIALLQLPVVFFPVAIAFEPANGWQALNFLSAMIFSVGIFAGAIYLIFKGFNDIPSKPDATLFLQQDDLFWSKRKKKRRVRKKKK